MRGGFWRIRACAGFDRSARQPGMVCEAATASESEFTMLDTPVPSGDLYLTPHTNRGEPGVWTYHPIVTVTVLSGK